MQPIRERGLKLLYAKASSSDQLTPCQNQLQESSEGYLVIESKDHPFPSLVFCTVKQKVDALTYPGALGVNSCLKTLCECNLGSHDMAIV